MLAILIILKSKIGFSINSISFNSLNSKVGECLLNYKKNLNVIGQINENFWNNKNTLQLTIRDLKIVKPIVLNNKHISLILKSKTGFSIKSISFNSVNTKIGEYLMSYKNSINVVGQINENIWNNKKALQLTIRDVIL